MMNWFLMALKKFADFSSRSRRKEYWFFVLFYLLIYIVLAIVDNMTGMAKAEYGGVGPLGGLFMLAMIVPSIAVAARRLHDIGKSGWWQLLAIVPLIGAIVLLIWYVKDGEPGTNRFGANPKEAAA